MTQLYDAKNIWLPDLDSQEGGTFPAAKRDDFISAQFALIFCDTGKVMECSAQSPGKRRLPFDVWKPKLTELLARLTPEFFLEKLAALLEEHVDRRDGTKDDLWCCRRVLYYIAMALFAMAKTR